ncbi:MAG: dihydroorotate dehydrogenase electron transfer subunit [Candidatus Omnitrophota bacterium]|nr:dihydroorotate dehydrogenase electron transfer subunit [Candidatus Omnitrophota bacterium]MDZ4241691.1 dihydroorotate dehydrogenase electron transfer subunit [Candidatus Omnitrophota bacterium]
MAKLQNIFPVISNEKLCDRFYRLCIDAKPILKKIRPGQFVHVRVKGGLEPFFRRPFSVYRAKKCLELFYEPVGPGTKIMASYKPGDAVDVLGPLGTPFALPPKGVKNVVMVAGGIGIAPFLILSDVLKGRRYRMTLLYGGRTKGHVYPMREFRQNGCEIHVATDDGSAGVKGRVSKLFSKIIPDPKKTFLYTCGPAPMMAAVQDFAREHGLPGQAACEEVMACALGACLGCSIKTTAGYRTVCYDGPVFDLQDVLFHD